MGEKAVPLLIRKLEWQPSRLMQRLHQRFPNWNRGIAYIQGASDPRSGAAFALGEIGPAARPALPALEALTATSDLPSSWYVNMAAKAAAIKIKGEPLAPHIEELKDTSDCLKWYPKALLVGQFGTNAAAAVTVLLASLNPTNNGIIHGHALIALGQIRSQPEACVPAIASFLNSPDISSRQKAMSALLQFGSAASSAVPQIRQSLTDTDPWTRYMATNTLKRVDPEAAKRAGIP
jgi:HEAT repeat protein